MRILTRGGIALVIALAVGCAKKQTQPTASSSSDTTGAPAAAARKPAAQDLNPMVESALADLEKKVQAQQFDAAVGSLVTLKEFPKSDKEQEAYDRQLHATLNALATRASQGDEAARANQQLLGRMMTGR